MDYSDSFPVQYTKDFSVRVHAEGLEFKASDVTTVPKTAQGFSYEFRRLRELGITLIQKAGVRRSWYLDVSGPWMESGKQYGVSGGVSCR